MSILIDSRVGSKDLVKPLGSISKLAVLEFADAMFVGGGEGNKPVFVGIEIKTVKDALSCVASGRFAGHQLPGLVKEYDIVYLLIEGPWRANREGLLEVPYGKRWRTVNLGSRFFMWRDFELWLTSMESMGGLRMRFPYSRKETVETIKLLYRWWTHKDWGEHRSHLAANKSSSVLGVKHSLKRRIAAQLDGVGETRSKAVAEYFPSIFEMITAPVDEWMEIAGVGEKTAERVVKELDGDRCFNAPNWGK